MAPDVVQAAAELSQELQQNVPDIATVGVNRTAGEILVYVVRLTPFNRRLIPSTWQSFPVRVVRSGAVRPA